MTTTFNLRLSKQTALFTSLLTVALMITVFTPNVRAQTIAGTNEVQMELAVKAAIESVEYVAPEITADDNIHPEREYVLNMKGMNKTVFCLAQNAYFEAGGESFRGKLAVTKVVQARAKHPAYPNTECGVIRQSVVRANKRTCQFSWWCAGRRDIPLYDKRGEIKPRVYDVWYDCVKAALLVYNNKAGEIVNGATHFYATKVVRPSWSRSMQKVEVIGGHTFMKPRD